MKLTGVECLTSSYTQNDIDGLVTVMASTLLASPAAALVWAKVDPSDAKGYIRKRCSRTLEKDFKVDCITEMKDYTDLPAARHAAQLVVRDSEIESPNSDVVSHAGYYYYPAYPGLDKEVGSETPSLSNSYPTGYVKELPTLILQKILTDCAKLFGGLPCFALESISTLTPTYLGHGLAKKQVAWVYPYADHFNLPVVLAASPLGLGLYRKCGFEEYRQHDIIVDLTPFGGEGLHRHVIMVRWPKDSEKLPQAWKDWKAKNSVTS